MRAHGSNHKNLNWYQKLGQIKQGPLDQSKNCQAYTRPKIIQLGARAAGARAVGCPEVHHHHVNSLEYSET